MNLLFLLFVALLVCWVIRFLVCLYIVYRVQTAVKDKLDFLIQQAKDDRMAKDVMIDFNKMDLSIQCDNMMSDILNLFVELDYRRWATSDLSNFLEDEG